MSEEPKWRRFEKLVAKIQRDLSPDALVTHDEKIIGKNSGEPRQIDVSVRKRVGQYDLLIVMSCKDHKDPVDINDLGAFITDVEDVKANHGAMVAANGFTEGAKKLALAKGISLYRLIDAEKHDWQTEMALPSVCEETFLKGYQLVFSATGPFGISLEDQQNLIGVQLYDVNHKLIGTIEDLLVLEWNARKMPAEPGRHTVQLGGDNIYKIFHDKYCRVKVEVIVIVERRFYFGWWNVEQLSGFADELKGILTARNLKMRPITPETIKNKWQKINNPKELAIEPVIIIQTFALKFAVPI